MGGRRHRRDVTNRAIFAGRAHDAALLGKGRDQRRSRGLYMSLTLITSAGEHIVVATVP